MEYNPFGGGLWFIPAALILAALYSFYRGYKQSKSGSVYGQNSFESDENVSFWKCPATIFGYIFTAALVISYFVMLSDK